MRTMAGVHRMDVPSPMMNPPPPQQIPNLRIVQDEPASTPLTPKRRPARRKRMSLKKAVRKELTKWLRKNPRRAAYWTGILHGAIGVLAMTAAYFVVSAVGTLLLLVAAMAIAWAIGRRY